jgi:hypothetical protein
MSDLANRRRPAATQRQLGHWALAALVATVVAGCGSVSPARIDGGPTAADGPPNSGSVLQTFLGTWTLGSGTITLTCSGLNMVNPVTGNIVWQAGTSSDLMEPANSSSTGCVLLASASGKTATASPNQTCNKGGMDLMLTGYTFVVGAGGTTATETGNGTETITTGGVGTSCTYAETATYTKSP